MARIAVSQGGSSALAAGRRPDLTVCRSSMIIEVGHSQRSWREEQVGLPGERVCGTVLHRVGSAAVVTTFWRPPSMTEPHFHEFGPLNPATT